MDPAHPKNATGFQNLKAYTWLLEGAGTGTCGSGSAGVNIGYFDIGPGPP